MHFKNWTGSLNPGINFAIRKLGKFDFPRNKTRLKFEIHTVLQHNFCTTILLSKPLRFLIFPFSFPFTLYSNFWKKLTFANFYFFERMEKPKRVSLTLAEKASVLEWYDKLPPLEKTLRVASEVLSVHVSTLHRILKGRSKIVEGLGINKPVNRKRKRVGTFEELDVAVLEWFENARYTTI